MLNTIKQFLGLSPKTDFSQLVENGAVILDVRTPQEYNSGHIKDSQNIPLNEFSGKISRLNKNRIIITCCASGLRSGIAKKILKSKGFSEVFNGGNWNSLHRKLNINPK